MAPITITTSSTKNRANPPPAARMELTAAAAARPMAITPWASTCAPVLMPCFAFVAVCASIFFWALPCTICFALWAAVCLMGTGALCLGAAKPRFTAAEWRLATCLPSALAPDARGAMMFSFSARLRAFWRVAFASSIALWRPRSFGEAAAFCRGVSACPTWYGENSALSEKCAPGLLLRWPSIPETGRLLCAACSCRA